MFFLDRDCDQNIFDWDQHQNLFLKGSGPRPKTFSRRDRDQNFFRPDRDRDEIFFSPGPGPKRTGPAHVYPKPPERIILASTIISYLLC
jgi:hypothetical protein